MRAWMLVALVACSSTQAVDDWTGPPVDTGTVDTGGDPWSPPFAGRWRLDRYTCDGWGFPAETFDVGAILDIRVDGSATFQGETWQFLDERYVDHGEPPAAQYEVSVPVDGGLIFEGLLGWRDEPCYWPIVTEWSEAR